jgi:hypothetical protein
MLSDGDFFSATERNRPFRAVGRAHSAGPRVQAITAVAWFLIDQTGSPTGSLRNSPIGGIAAASPPPAATCNA